MAVKLAGAVKNSLIVTILTIGVGLPALAYVRAELVPAGETVEIMSSPVPSPTVEPSLAPSEVPSSVSTPTLNPSPKMIDYKYGNIEYLCYETRISTLNEIKTKFENTPKTLEPTYTESRELRPVSGEDVAKEFEAVQRRNRESINPEYQTIRLKFTEMLQEYCDVK